MYQTEGSAGFDLHSIEDVWIKPSERLLIKTGLYIQLPAQTELQIRSRSGLALYHGIVVLNSPGTIDSDYTGEVCVILINHSTNAYHIKIGDRIAQAVLKKYERAEFEEVETLEFTQRLGGFGSTGN